mmetsp:Transcript_13307/g.17440  ORF Transcript_13307/g.17440 Transcript_13307/m.17440 type:complete len:368 (+) Transcript_13307:312-1415(+)
MIASRSFQPLEPDEDKKLILAHVNQLKEERRQYPYLTTLGTRLPTEEYYECVLPLHSIVYEAWREKRSFQDVERILSDMSLNVVKRSLVMKDGCLDATPLHLASCSAPRAVICGMLRIAPEAAVIQDKYGEIPLHYAAEYQNMDAVELLIQSFPDGLLVKGVDKRNPIALAEFHNSRRMVLPLLRWLLKYRCIEIMSRGDNDSRTTPLSTALQQSSREIGMLLPESYYDSFHLLPRVLTETSTGMISLKEMQLLIHAIFSDELVLKIFSLKEYRSHCFRRIHKFYELRRLPSSILLATLFLAYGEHNKYSVFLKKSNAMQNIFDESISEHVLSYIYEHEILCRLRGVDLMDASETYMKSSSESDVEG